MASVSLWRLTGSQDSGPWRVDWFGACSYSALHGVRRTQPSIQVAVSPLSGGAYDPDAIRSADATMMDQQRLVWVSVGALPMVRVGDVWANGLCIVEPDYTVERFANIEIHPETCPLVKAGLPLDKSYLLPFAEHPWHRNASQSYCLVVPLPQGKRLLVPCVELIRFYFGSSTNLLDRLFTGIHGTEVLWESMNFDPKRRHLHLKLAQGLSFTSATDIGRIALDKRALSAARAVHASLVRVTAAAPDRYPCSFFPFIGHTTIEASGQWVSFGAESNATFVVFRLRSCSHPFPFRSLTYEASSRRVPRHAEAAEAGEQQANGASRGRATRLGSHPVQDEDPGKARKPKVHWVGYKVRFPDLLGKYVWQDQFETQDSPAMLKKSASGGLDPVSFGEEHGATKTRRIDVADAPGDPISARETRGLPPFVSTVIKRLFREAESENRVVVIAPVIPPGGTHPVFPMPTVVDDDGVLDPRQLRTCEDGQRRPRRACFVEMDEPSRAKRWLVVIEGVAPVDPAKVFDVPSVDVCEAAKKILDC